MIAWQAALMAFATSCVSVAVVRQFALRHAMLDRPNPRSSHAAPTPRGGGVGIVLAVAAVWLEAIALQPATAMALAGVILVAATGLVDDRTPLGAWPRLIAHCAGGLSLLPLAMTPDPVPGWMGWWAVAWWVFWAVSAINVVNFMDGIDGLIGSQILLFGAHVALLGSEHGNAQVLGVALAGSCAGFLIWNWPPARIFMGDAGSGALGILAVAAGVLLLREGAAGIVAVFLPLYALFLDATATLLRRALRGEPVMQAHRQHLYQRLSNGGWGHRRTTLLYAAVAAAGIAVAQTHTSPVWPLISGGYFLVVLAGGVLLHRYAALPLERLGCHETVGAA